MYLFHGTSASRARQAATDGLKPPSVTGLSNWEDHPSCDEAVYLTSAYAVYFGHVAASKTEDDEGAYLVIDSERLEAHRLAADEDAVEQALRQRKDDPLRGMDIGARTLCLKEQLLQLVDNGFTWDWSLKALGNCTYHGTIPPEAIVKIVTWNRNSPMAFACDPAMTLMNFHIVGSYYRKMAAMLAELPCDVPPSPFDAIYPEDNIHALKEFVSISTPRVLADQ